MNPFGTTTQTVTIIPQKATMYAEIDRLITPAASLALLLAVSGSLYWAVTAEKGKKTLPLLSLGASVTLGPMAYLAIVFRHGFSM